MAGIIEYLLCLPDHLHFFFGIAILLKGIDLRH